MKPPGIRSICCVLLAVGLTAGVVSCSSDGAEPEPTGTGKAVAFSIDGIQSRALVTSSVRRIGVFGYSHTGTWAANGTTAVPDYYLNQAVIDRNGTGNWTYNGVTKYWPTDDKKVSFFAYAPYDDLDEYFNLIPSTKNVAGSPQMTYSVPASVYDQIDILYNMQRDQTRNTNNGTVAFTMDHALTRIGFQIKLKDNEKDRPFVVTINELSLQNVVSAGTLDMSKALNADDLWMLNRPATDAGLAAYTFTPAPYGGMNTIQFDARKTESFDFTDVLVADQYLMLLPQPLAAQGDGLAQQKVVLKYTVLNDLLNTTEEIEKEIILYNTTLPKWEAGKGINYQLTLSVVDGLAIEFQVAALDPWGNGNNGGTVIGDVN